MAVKFGVDSPLLSTWLLIHQTYNLVLKCEDAVFAKEGLTTEHHAVLMAIKLIGSQAIVTDVARFLDRSPNTISLIADRMEKRGLIKKMRDLRDRRLVRLVITSEGNKVFEGANIASWELMRQILSPLSEKEQLVLSDLLETVRQKAFGYLSPGESIKEIQVEECKNMSRFNR
ncbi:MAG: MarR family transcriptional regulator [Dehalococcoidia bacterium]